MAASKLEPIGILSKLKAKQVKAIKSNQIVLFAAISSAQSNLGVDSMAPAQRSFKKGYWSLGPRPTTRGDGEGPGPQSTIAAAIRGGVSTGDEDA